MKPPSAFDLPYDAWRPGQRLAIRTAVSSETPYVVVQAPTGAGKSVIAAGVMRFEDRRSGVLTATRGLQDQYQRTLPWLTDIRGMSNYECLAARQEFRRLFRLVRGTINCDDGPCRSGHACSLRDHGCYYFDAVREAMAAQWLSTNYACWLAQRQYGRGFGLFHWLVLDEAHALPEELMAASRIDVPLAMLEGRLPKSSARWRQWAAAQLEQLKPTADQVDDERQRRVRLIDHLTRLTQIDDTWAWDVLQEAIVFEPTIPRLLMRRLVDPAAATRVLMLSATITPMTLRVLGIPDDDVTFHRMPSRFPVSHRPIYVVDSARVDHKMSGDQLAWWLSRIDKIISKRLDRKGILHAVSYARAHWLLTHSKHRGLFVAPRSAFELAASVDAFRAMKPPAILLSPSVMTGWDFPYAECEYAIVAKLPFPDTRSSIARARIAATDGYREHLTMQTLEQAVGRHVRASDDRGETFIVDNHARWFLPRSRQMGLGSASFHEAVSYPRGIPAPPPALS